MNKIVTKKKITTFLTYYGVFTLVLSILACLSWSYLLNAIDEVKPYEKINLFIESYGYDSKLENDIYSYLEAKDETQSIYEVNIYQYASDNDKITSYYDSFGSNADILILIEEDLIDMKDYVKNYFLELNEELLSSTLGSKKDVYTYYQNNNKNYAIKISDKENSNYQYLNEEIAYSFTGKENHTYYLLINVNSVNIGKYNQKSKTSNALLTLTYLLGESNG